MTDNNFEWALTVQVRKKGCKHVRMEYYDFKVFTSVLKRFTTKFAPLARVFRCAKWKQGRYNLKGVDTPESGHSVCVLFLEGSGNICFCFCTESTVLYIEIPDRWLRQPAGFNGLSLLLIIPDPCLWYRSINNKFSIDSFLDWEGHHRVFANHSQTDCSSSPRLQQHTSY